MESEKDMNILPNNSFNILADQEILSFNDRTTNNILKFHNESFIVEKRHLSVIILCCFIIALTYFL